MINVSGLDNWHTQISDQLSKTVKKACELLEQNKVCPSAHTDTGYYFTVKDYQVVLSHERTTSQERNQNEGKPAGPYRKKFTCTCLHASLYSDIMCCHVLACLFWLCLKELKKNAMKGDCDGKREKSMGDEHYVASDGTS